jgi:hypothetical protein
MDSNSQLYSNISHPPCCKLAQVVALSSPPFSVKLSVWLPSSCNATPLITKATQNWNKWPCVIAWADRVCWMNSGQGSQFECVRQSWCYVNPACWISKHLASHIQEWLRIYSNSVFSQLPKHKTHISNGPTRCHCLADSKTVDTGRTDEYLELANH